MIKFILSWLKHRGESKFRNTCTCEHNYNRCAKKITVTGNGVIGVSGYFQCGRFMAKYRSVSKHAKKAVRK